MKNKKNQHWLLIARMVILACLLWILVGIVSYFMNLFFPMREGASIAILTTVFSAGLVYLVATRFDFEELWAALTCSVIFIVVTIVLDVGTAGKSLSLWKLLHWHYWIQFVLYPVATIATLNKK